MAFSLKKRGQAKSHIFSNGKDDSNALGEVLHRSTKTKQKKKKKEKLLTGTQSIPSLESDIDLNTPSPSNENSIIYRSQCLCETHYDKQLIERNYNLTVDKLFDLMFGSNDFVRTYRKAQRFYDETETEWMINEATNHRERTFRYKVPYESTFVGKSTIFTREKQAIFIEAPGSHYTLETEVYNEGVKFSDTFLLILRYCLVQTSVTTTNLRVTAQIIYIKSVNGFIKQFIERNAFSASQEGLKDLNNRLNLIANFKMDQRRLSKGEPTTNVPTIDTIPPINQNELPLVQQLVFNDSHRNPRSFDPDTLLSILVFLVLILCFIQLYLYKKLEHTDLLLDKLAHLLKI